MKYSNIIQKINDISHKELLEGNYFSIENYSFHNAYKIIMDIINHDGKILIINDYDTDGIMSGYIIYQFLRNLMKKQDNIEIKTMTVHDDREVKFQDYHKKFNLIILVDIGINAYNFIEECYNNNIYTIVIDHHKIIKTNNKSINIHPRLLSYFDNLSASGLVIKFIEYAINKLGILFNNYSIFYVYSGIGTYTDMVGCRHENRRLLLTGYKNYLQNFDSFENIFNFISSKSLLSTKYFYYIILGSIFNSIYRVKWDYKFNYNNLKDNNFNEIYKLYLFKRKYITNILSQIKIENINNVLGYFFIDDYNMLGLLGTISNKVLYEKNFDIIIGVCKTTNNNYKLTIRSKNKIFFINMITKYFIKHGGHEYVYSGIIQDKEIVNKIVEEIFNLLSLIKYKKEKRDIINIEEIEIETLLQEYNSLYPISYDLKDILFRIDKSSLNNLRGYIVNYNKLENILQNENYIITSINPYYALIKNQLYLEVVS
jgi:single-stranded DNA-specific DHH superfamily exonuclease